MEIPVGELTFTARAEGPDDGRLVLLLHGFPQTSYSWCSQLSALGAAGYRAVAFDQRGYSPGARPADVSAYAIPHLVADVLAGADWLGAHPFHPVGHRLDVALGREAAEATAKHVDGPYRFEVFEGVSHWIPEEAADRLNGLLLEHLAGAD